MKPVEVNVFLSLFKVVAIEKEEHSIKLQFQINLECRENRATYYNLKSDSYLNALSRDEINTLWLPLVVYHNTDQQKTTRLGENWEGPLVSMSRGRGMLLEVVMRCWTRLTSSKETRRV